MSKRPRRSFTPEFKTEAVALVMKSGKSIGQIANELDLTETSLRDWVEKAEKAAPEVPLVLSERAWLESLRKENQHLTKLDPRRMGARRRHCRAALPNRCIRAR